MSCENSSSNDSDDIKDMIDINQKKNKKQKGKIKKNKSSSICKICLCENKCECEGSTEAVDIQNIKSVLRMNDYLKRLFYSYNSICEILGEFLEQLYSIYNDLNFQGVNQETIESYNKAIIFIYESIAGVLSDTISGIDYVETLLVKPVEQNYTTHKINLTYFVNDSSTLSRFLGTVSNVSISLINNQLRLDRFDSSYIYSQINQTNIISVNDFRYQLDLYIFQTKKLIGFFYKDVEYVKNAIRTLLTIISETITIKTSNKYIKKWTSVVEEVGNSIILIKKCTANMSGC